MIVMIVLAGAIILTLNNTGIIGKASGAVDEYNDSQIRTLVQTYWTEAYAEAIKDNIPITEEYLQTRVEQKIAENKLNVPADYVINAKTSGITVVRGWKQDGTTITRGKETIYVGDEIDYEANVDSYDGKWQALGASEDGELLILSTKQIGMYWLGSGQTLQSAQQDWLNGAQLLDDMCVPYGKGEGATGARSIRIEDVDKITGYDKTTYGKNTVSEYGASMAFAYNGTNRPDYYVFSAIDSLIILTGQLTNEHKEGFHYYDGKEFVKVDLSKKSGQITSVETNGYVYVASDSKNLDSDSDAYEMLFTTNEYWLASPYTLMNADAVSYGLHYIW